MIFKLNSLIYYVISNKMCYFLTLLLKFIFDEGYSKRKKWYNHCKIINILSLL